MIVEKRQRIRKCFKNNAVSPENSGEWERIINQTKLNQQIRHKTNRLSTPISTKEWEDESALAPVTQPRSVVYVCALISGVAYFAVSSFFFTG